MDLSELAKVAIKAVKSAGEIIRKASEQDIEVLHKEGGNTYASQVVTEIDRKCDVVIREILKQSCLKYDIAILTEEEIDDGSRFEKDYFWCVDPLDGTLAFINKTSGFSVSIALVSKTGKPVIGVVYNPTKKGLYHAIEGQGVYRNEKLWCPETSSKDNLTYITDKSLAKTPKAEEIELILQQKLLELNLSGFTEIQGGGAVWNAIRVLEEAPAIMLKLPKEEKGGGSLWDYAATSCIFNELGYRATDFNGNPLELNKSTDAFMNHKGVFYACW
ncbi:MAG: inositol monophosphatase family protein [Winogradskyella sp.]